MYKYAALGVLFFIGASSAFAEEIPEMPVFMEEFPPETFRREEELLLLGERLVITATKTKKNVREAPATVTVITGEEIRNMGARDLMDVLHIVPGLHISRHMYGVFQSIEVRGIRTNASEKVLLLIDGHSVNFPYNGSPTWFFDDLVIGNIKQVEIIRSPASAIYGTNAFMAIINVITKTAGDIDGVEVKAGGGSFDTQQYSLLFGNKADKFAFDGYIDFLKTDGPKLWVEEDALSPASYSEAPGYTQNRNEKSDVNLRCSYGDISLSGKYMEKKKGPYIGTAYALNDESQRATRILIGELTFNRSINKKLDVMAKVFGDYIDGSFHWEIYPEGFPGFPDGMLGNPKSKMKNYGGELKLDYAVWKHDLITLGAIFEKEKQYQVRHFTNFDPNTYAPLPGGFQDISDWGNYNQDAKRRKSAYYIQNDLNLMEDYNIDLLMGARFDHYSDFGGALSPRAGLIWRFQPDMDLKLLYGRAFNAPNFEQLYIRNNPSTQGNPNLKPEEIQTSEIGLVYRPSSKINTSLTYFYSEITDMIQVKSRKYENSGTMLISGVEAEIRADFGKGHYSFLNYTFQNPRQVNGIVQDVPNHLANLGVNFKLNDYLNSDTIVHYTGRRAREESDPRDKLSDYTTVDQTFILGNFYETLELRASVYNLFDVKYEDPAPRATIPNDFPRPGISYFLELAYKF